MSKVKIKAREARDYEPKDKMDRSSPRWIVTKHVGDRLVFAKTFNGENPKTAARAYAAQLMKEAK